MRRKYLLISSKVQEELDTLQSEQDDSEHSPWQADASHHSDDGATHTNMYAENSCLYLSMIS